MLNPLTEMHLNKYLADASDSNDENVLLMEGW